MTNVRRKCFISYHHADEAEVRQFIYDFDISGNVFIFRALGLADDIINSNDTDYVMSQIRLRYLKDSTVTLLLLGSCTWARRYVDWELQSSLRRGATTTPNGLLGIKLRSYTNSGGKFPNRFNKNLKHEGMTDCYTRHMHYPASTAALASAIDAAFDRRKSHSHLIVNPRDRMKYNRQCP